MQTHHVWDPFIRVFHIALAVGFVANALILPNQSTLHLWVGYALGGLVLMRIFWGLIGPRTARFSTFLQGPAALFEHLTEIATHRRRAHRGHSPLGGWMVVNLLGTVLAIAVSGWMISLGTPALGWAEDLHEGLVVWASLSISAHVVAVLWESRRTGINLISAMITGRKLTPDGVHLRE
ncbi:MAG: cytochrome b/b6 domain-containing protein [Roseovarius sp.]